MAPKTKEQYQEIRERSREQILDAAAGLFSEKGFERTSVNDIAKKAEVSKGLVYNYFEGKKELLIAFFEKALQEMDDIMGEIPSQASPKQKLEAMIIGFVNDITLNPGFWRLFATLAMQEQRFPEIRRMMSAKIHEYYDILEELFREDGYQDPRGEARLVAVLFDGIGVQYLALGNKYPLEEIKDKIIQKYCRNGSN